MAENLDDNYFSQFLPRDESAVPDSDPTATPPVAPDVLKPGEMGSPLDADPTIAGVQAQKHIDQGEELDRARDGSATSIFSQSHPGARGALDDRSFGRLSPEQQKQWITDEKAAAQSQRTRWQGVNDYVLSGLDAINRGFARAAGLPDDPNAPSDPVVAGLRTRVDGNIALAKRREFLADQMEQGLLKPAELTAGMAAFEETMKGFGDTGVANMVAGSGRAAEYATDIISGGIDKPRNDATFYEDIVNDALQVGKKGGGTLQTAGELAPRLYATTLRHVGAWISAKTKELFPGDEARQFEFGTQLANGAGSMIAFMGPSFGAAMLSRASPASLGYLAAYGDLDTTALLAAQKLAETQATRGALATASGLGAPMQGEAMAQDAEDAMRRGVLKADGTPVTDSDVRKAFGFGLIGGATEGLPLEHLMSKFGGSPIMAIASQMLQEGGQEWGQQVIENLTAQNYYDPDRRWDEGAWESAAVGAILGGGMEGGKIGLEKGKEAYNQFKGVREARLRTKGVVNDIEPIAAAPEDGPQPGAPAAPAVAPAVAVEPPKAEPAPAPLKPALAWPAEEGGVRGTQDDELEAMAGMTQGAPESDRHADLSEVENDPEFADFRDLVGEVPTTAETGTPSYVERLSEALDVRNTERQPSGTDRGTTATETAEVPDETAAEAEPGTGSEDAGLPEPIHLTSPTPSSVESNIQATRDLAEMARARMSADERMEGLSAKQLGAVYQDVLGSKPPFGSSKVKMRAAIAAGRQGDEKTVHAAIDRATGRGNAQPVSATAGNQTTEGNAKQTPSVAAQGGAETATPEMQDRFRDVLRSDIPSKKWAKALGATPAQMKQLIKAGVRQGLLRKGRGNVVRRTPLAKRGTSSRVATAAPVTEAPALTGKAAVIGSPENMAAREKAARETMTSPEWLGKTLNAGIDTSKAPGYMTPEWKANRQYVAEDGSIIQGFDAMVANETARLLAQHEVAQERKAFIVIGYPGAGKSTLATPLSEQTRAAEVSPDPIKARIPEYDGGSNAGGVHEESADVSKGVLANMIEGGYNIVLEKLGSTESSVTKPAAALRAAGYHVTLVYVDVPKAVAMERAIGRAKRNGRTIAVSTYDADIKGVFGALKNEGVTDESSHFEWKEPGGWQFVDRSPSLQGIHITGVDQPGPREPGVGGRGLDRQDGRGDQSRGGTGEGEAGRGRVDVPAHANEAWLSELLASHGIDPNLYGKGEAKTLANLLSELTGGESTLYVEDGKLVRRLQTLGIDVSYRDPVTGQLYRLREDRQEFRDGRVRRRDLFSSLGEKLKAGEEPATSIGRALEEELGVAAFEQKGGIRSRETKGISQSYPGLTTENTIHDAEVVLPQSEFRPEYQEVQKEKTNYFVWQAVNEAGDLVVSDVPRADRLIRQREAEGAAPFPDFLYDYASRLDSARGDNVAFAPVMAEVRADKRVTKAMALELAHVVGVQPTKGTTKAAALASIEARHADLANTKEALNAERRALGEGEGSVSEESVPGRGETLGEDGLPEGPLGDDRAGSGSDVRSGVGADAGSPGHAGELPGSTPAAPSDPGASARNGDARSDRDAARERAKAIRQSIKADRDAERDARAYRARANYEITPADKIGQGGAKTKIKGNIEALQLAAKIEAENRQATEDEKAVLVKYVGWGAFAQDMFSEHKPEFAKERAILKDLLTPSEYKAARASVTNAHYTSEDVINGVWKALDHLGFQGGRALEPSAGIGHFIGLMPNHLKASTDWSAVELDTVSGRILKALYGATDVRVQGFETAEWPDGFFDLAISNVPFAETGPYDPRYKQKMTLHDYFFRKALDKVRPGGIVAFITSSGTLDKVNSGPRRELAKHGTFLGAIRLPGGSKGAFKSNAGTDVTTDVIFMRRRVEGEPVADNTWLGLTEIKTPEGPTAINAYFAQHPEMMLGKMRLTGSMYRADQPVLIGSSEELGDKIAEAAKAGLPENAMLDRGVTPADIAPDVDTSPLGKPGAYYQKDKKTYRVLNGVGVEQKLSTADAQKIQQFVGLRDTINALLAGQQQEGFDGTALRADLNKAYDSFVKDHGPINKVVTTVTNRLDKAGNSITIRKYPNMSAFEDDPDAYKVAAIEVYNEKTGDTKKAAIFNEDILAAYERPEIQSSSDALAVSLNEFGRIDMPFIAEQLGVPLNEAIAQLGDKVYLDPKGDNWLAAEQYLAGDVVEKLEQAKAAAKADEKYARNVAALEKAQPEPLTRADIRINMGAPWLPLDVYQEFIYDEFGVRNAPIIYNEAVQKWSLAQKIFFPPSAQTKWGTGKTAPGDVLEAALNSTRINITFEDAAGNRIHDVKAEEEANARVQALRDIFNGAPARGIESWVWSSDSRAERLEPLYNYQFNRLAPEKYDGSHLTFPGLARVVTYSDGSTGTINLTPHRVNAVWRIIRNGNSLLGHVVGAGKTFTMIMSGMEQKRLGLIQRPMYVVPNHMLEQFSNEFLQAYPNAKLLVASKDEMSLKKRKEFIARAAADKWDGIIITHDAFGRVRMSDAAYKEFYEQQIEELRDVIEQQKGEHGGRSPTVKQTEKRMKSLEAKLKKLLKVEHKDEGTTFEEMGVDFLYVDEAHLFKNLSFATQHARVKGISNSSESQRATDLFVKIRHLEKSRPGRSNVFASGTPVSNTMAELYTMQRYQQLDELKKYGIDQFDAWAHTFGQMHSEIERKVDGSMRAVESFSRFINIPELMAIWSRVADMQTADMLNLPRPKLQDGKIGVVEAQANEAEIQYMQSLVERAERMKREKVDPAKDNMLKIVSEGRKVATDMRLLDKAAPFNENGKVAKAVDKIFDIWQKGADPALGQMVFLDMGVPGSKGGAKSTPVKGEDKGGVELPDAVKRIQDAFRDEAAADGDVSTDDVEAEANQESDDFFAGLFNLYEDIRDRLIAKGIPKEQIAFIHEAKGDEGKERMFEAVREGKIRVFMGSTGKMGVGTNVQKRLIAMHHIDAPWKPAEVEQRDGRILRQGNRNPEIQIYRYVTKNSFDAYMWQILERKAKFIGQLLSGARGVRDMEDIDNPLPEASALKAAASGDPRILEHATLSKEITELEMAKRAQLRAAQSAKSTIASTQNQIETATKYLLDYTVDADKVQDLSGDNFAVTLSTSREPQSYDKRTEAGEAVRDYILRAMDQMYYGGKREFSLGQMSGFEVNAEVKRTEDGLDVRPVLSGTTDYRGGSFLMSKDSNPSAIMQRFERVMKDVPGLKAATEIALQKAKADLPRLEKTATQTTFAKQDILDKAQARLAAIENEINAPVVAPAAPATPEAREPDISSAVEPEVAASLIPKRRLSLTPRARRMAPEIVAAIEDELRRALPRDVSGRVTDLVALNGHLVNGLTIFHERLVEISLAFGEAEARQTVRHEVIHALRGDSGRYMMRSLYTNEEWATLVARAVKIGSQEDARYRDIYKANLKGQPRADARLEEQINQERVAHMAETWVDGATYGTAIDKLLYRMKEFVDAIARALRALGFNTPSDVFGTESDRTLRQSFSGEIADRGPSTISSIESRLRFDRDRRAEALGFDADTPYYHGTGAAFDAFSREFLGKNFDFGGTGQGFFFTTKKPMAEKFAKGSSGRVIDARLRIQKPFVVNVDESLAREAEKALQYGGPLQAFMHKLALAVSDKLQLFEPEFNRLGNYAFTHGYDSVVIDFGDKSPYGKFVIIPDPAQIRDALAAFNPDNRASPELMASLIGQRGAENMAKSNPAAKEALRMAQEMDAAHATEDQIWTATTNYLAAHDKTGDLIGVYMGVDGQWRIEVDDSKVEPTLHGLLNDSNVGSVPEMLPHPTLEAAHPDLENASAVLHIDSRRYKPPHGYATGANFMRVNGSTPEDVTSVGMHEYQHLLQAREGFARGTSPAEAGKRHLPDLEKANTAQALIDMVANAALQSKTPIIKKIDDAVRALDGKYGRIKITPEMIALAKDPGMLAHFVESIPSSHEAYRRSAGETEARMVQKRLDMTAEERRERPPYDDYDVAPYMQVVHGENGAALSAEPEDMASKLEGTAANKVRTPTKSQSVESLSRIIEDLKAALGMTATQGRYGLSVTDQSTGVQNNRPPKTWRFKPQKSLRGQYHGRVGAARYKLSTDIEAIAHEGGHHLEHILGQPLLDLKRNHADELRSYAYRSFAPAAPNGSAPQLQPSGFSGLALDADVQRLLIESVAADGQALATSAPGAIAKNQRLRAELEYRLGQNAADTVFNDAYVHAQQARSLADLPQYVQQRFSETGTAQPAANDQRASISEGFAEFFREYITNPDQARKFAPEFYADFEDLLDANAPQLLQSIERAQLVTTSKAYDDYLRATTLDRARADLVSEADQSWFTRALDSKILRGIGQEGTISGAVYRVFSDAMGSLHGAANQAYRMFIDEAHPFYIGTKRLLEQADQNHITDGQGRAVSLAIHQNPYKLMRSIGDSFKTGLRWIQDGVPNYRETGGVRSASLHDALAMVMGKDWNLESYQDFGVYLESRRAVEEWQAWNTKRQTLANLGGKIDVARAQNRVLRDHLAKARAKAERRDRANTANDAVMREYDRALQGLTTEEARLVRELQEGQVATPGMTPQQERNVRMRLADTRQKINTYESRRTEFAARRNAVNTDRQSLDVHIGRFESAIAKREAIIDRSRQHLDHLRSGGLQRAPHRIGMMEHQARLAGLEKMYPSLPQAANMVYDFVWQSAVHDFQAGRLTKEELDYRATRRHFYVPFARDLSDMIEERGVGGRKTVEKFAKDKTFEGSDRAIRNPIETIIDQTFHRAAATHFNDVMKAFTNLADAVGVGGAAVAERVDQGQTLAADQNGFRQLENRLVSLGYAPDDAREMVKRIESDFGDTQLLLQWSPEGYGPNRPLLLPLWENGERKLIRLNDPEWAGLVYNSVNGMGREMSNLLIDVLAKPASLLRWSVTTNPAFVIPNIIRDMASAWILTGNLLDPRTWPIVTQMRGIYHEMAQTDMARLYQEVAGLMGGQNVAALSKVRDKADVMALEARGLHLRPLRLGFATAIGAAAGFATLGPSGAGFGALVGAGLHNGASRFFETLSHFSDLSETATRMGTFTQAYRAALSYNPTLTPYQAAQEAAYVARDLIDFGRRGSNMLVAARLVPFLNANVQGLDKAVRTLLARSDRGFSLSGAKLLSAGVLGGAAGYIAAGATLGATGAFVVPAAAVALAKRSEVARRLLAPAAKRIAALPLSQDEERILGDSAKAWFNLLCYTGLLVAMGAVSGGGDPDEYKMISDRVKNRSQPVKLGGSWYQIPKAFEFSVPANIISAGIATQFDKDPRFWERVRGSIAENIAPPGLPQTAKLWSDIRGNYNSMTGGQIVPEWQQKLPPQDQFNAYTSEMAIFLARSVNANPGLKATAETIGQTLFATPNFEVSPAIIDYVLSTGGGYWGKDIQKVSNQVAGVPTGPNSGRLAEFPIIGTVLQRVSIDPYRANDALEAYYNTMQPTGKAFDRAATGYDFVLTNQGQGPANALLATMDDDHRAYALLMATNDTAAKRSHPLNRLKDVLGSVRSIEQDLALGRLADTSSKMDPQPITLAPAKAAEVRDTLAKIKAIEAWNTMVDMGTDQFANRQLIDVKPTMSLLEAQSPETADELQRRYDRKKIQELEVSNDIWLETKADLLKTWSELSPTNEPMPNPRKRRTPQPLPMMRLGGPVPPLGITPDEEMMGAGYPSQAADATRPLDEGIVHAPTPADGNMREIRPDMPNNLGPAMQPNPASPNNMDELRWQQKLM